MDELTHLSLFSGIGGLDIAAETAGFKTVGQCEWADYPTKVLEKHWPDVPRWRDIRMLTKESFYEKTGLRTVDVVSGGFPCQPFSVAGKRRGKEDDRYLWPEMLRVISELRPAWVVGENVAGIVNMALDQVYADLENEGYTVQAFIIPACGVNAPHRRERVCIVGWNGEQTDIFYSNAKSEQHQNEPESEGEVQEQPVIGGLCRNIDTTIVANAYGTGLQTQRPKQQTARTARGCERRGDAGKRRTAQPGLGGEANGLPNWLDEVRRGWLDGSWEYGIPRIAVGVKDRVNRLKCLGNAVVPQQFYPVFQAIADIERGIIHG